MEDPTRAVAPVIDDMISLVVPWAIESGLAIEMYGPGAGLYHEVGTDEDVTEPLARFARLAFEAGRAKGLEEAAKVAESKIDPEWPDDDLSTQAESTAAAIRSLAPAVPISEV